jgi:hypothetical protein
MKISSSRTSFLALAVLFLTLPAFAGTNRGSVQVSKTFVVNGQQLKAGEYSVTWEGSGPDVQVNFLKGKKIVATSPAHLVDLTSSPAADAALIKTNNDGSISLAHVRFGGKKKALAFDGVAPQS